MNLCRMPPPVNMLSIWYLCLVACLSCFQLCRIFLELLSQLLRLHSPAQQYYLMSRPRMRTKPALFVNKNSSLGPHEAGVWAKHPSLTGGGGGGGGGG